MHRWVHFLLHTYLEIEIKGVSYMDFEQLVKARHSAVNFEQDITMTEQDFKQIFELTKLAPSAYNLQFTNYLVITDDDKKEKVRELSYGQYKIHTASAVVIVLGDKNSLTAEAASKIYSPLKMLNMIDEVEYDMTLQAIENFQQGLKNNAHGIELELARNVGIHAMFFMLSAKHYGFDTCPMHVHNVEQLREEFRIPAHLEPVMMITVGKSVDRTRPRGYRKPVGEFVQFNLF